VTLLNVKHRYIIRSFLRFIDGNEIFDHFDDTKSDVINYSVLKTIFYLSLSYKFQDKKDQSSYSQALYNDIVINETQVDLQKRG
jgi:hypothetical protein